MTIGRQFVIELRRVLTLRRVSEGIAMLDGVGAEWDKLSPSDPNAAEILLLVAEWVDAGYRNPRLLNCLLAKFPAKSRPRLPLEDYLRVRMGEAFQALSTEDVDTAIDILDFVLRAETDAAHEHLLTLAHFWKGRAHRKKGEYELAFKEIVAARQMAQTYHEGAAFTAVIQIHESWLLFQKGQRKEALRLLTHAESTLKTTDHYLARGNIESARGRIVRRSGEYAKALEHFERAIDLYSAGIPNHRNLARALVNSAYVKRLLALQLRKRIDSRASKADLAGSTRQASAALGSQAATLQARYQELYDDAISELRRAQEIYEAEGHFGGLGAVTVNSGYIHLDAGDIDRAAREAVKAYQLGHEKNDHILMARARVLQAATENAKIEEQLGEEKDLAVHAQNAKQFSDEALSLAKLTQNRRLLASAHIERGMTAANDFFQDWDLARRCVTEATEFIGIGENDRLLDELANLKSRIMRASGINDTLRNWSEGMVGNKTFQQVSEEFAEIVIPKVWQREDRKISRVAQTLSISPKKVRRILRTAGFLDRDGSTR